MITTDDKFSELGIEIFNLKNQECSYNIIKKDVRIYDKWFASNGKWYVIETDDLPIIKEFILVTSELN